MRRYTSTILTFLIIAALAACGPLSAAEGADPLVTVFQDNDHQFTGIAVSPAGRLFLCYPRWLPEHKYSVVEVLPGGKVKAFPDEKWNSWKKGEPGKGAFVCAQALFADSEENLWVVDPAAPELGEVVDGAAKLVKINLKTNSVERVYPFEPAIADKTSYLNDVRIDTKRKCAYLTDSGNGALVILSLGDGKARRVFYKNAALLSDPAYAFRVNGVEIKNEKGPLKINSDGIALTPDNKYLYFKPLTDNKLYRIETAALHTRKWKKGQKLEDKIEKLGTLTTTDGMICDPAGNLYLGDIENRELIRYGPDGRYEIFLKDSRLLWPDSYAVSKDGFLYVTCSQIHLMPWFNEGKDLRTTPYTVYKIKLPPEPPKKKKKRRGE
ncbi:MAG: L-dopachrome tautomerase-related protein [Candidatus Eremiobacteraeota bacterium]|nr:L-dopachrome tautomerase-related protein [Candidatus Eremiobacteraeota bacterium]